MVILTFVIPIPALLNTIGKFDGILANSFSFCKSKGLAVISDAYDLEPMPTAPHTPLWSRVGPEEVKGNRLQQISSTTGITCEHVSQSGPINYVGHSTSVLDRPHDRDMYYEIVADSNEFRKRYKIYKVS